MVEEKEVLAKLDSAVAFVLQTLREVESDSDILTNSMEDNVHHIMISVLHQIYNSNSTDRITAVGLIEMMKNNWINTITN